MKLVCFCFALLLLFAGSVDAAYIDDISTVGINDIQYFENGSVVSLDGISFTIPKGFGLIENESINCSDGNSTQSVRFFADGANEIIMVSAEPIVRYDLILSDYTPCDVDMDSHVINGHDGIEWSMVNGTYFIYFDNDCLVTVGSSNDSYFDKVIQ